MQCCIFPFRLEELALLLSLTIKAACTLQTHQTLRIKKDLSARGQRSSPLPQQNYVSGEGCVPLYSQQCFSSSLFERKTVLLKSTVTERNRGSRRGRATLYSVFPILCILRSIGIKHNHKNIELKDPYVYTSADKQSCPSREHLKCNKESVPSEDELRGIFSVSGARSTMIMF